MNIIALWLIGAVLIPGNYCGNVYSRGFKDLTKVEPRAMIRVCEKEGADRHCTYSQIYADPTFQVPMANPLFVDANGHFCFYAPQRQYTLEVSASIQTVRQVVDLRLSQTGDYFITPPKKGEK